MKIKGFILGFVIALSITVFASVSGGGKITAQLFNALLDIELPTGENTYSMTITTRTSNGTATVKHSSGTDFYSSVQRSSAGTYYIYPSTDFFKSNPTTVVSATHHGGVLHGTAITVENSTKDVISFRLSNIDGAAYDYGDIKVVLQRNGIDYKPYKTIRQILINNGFQF